MKKRWLRVVFPIALAICSPIGLAACSDSGVMGFLVATATSPRRLMVNSGSEPIVSETQVPSRSPDEEPALTEQPVPADTAARTSTPAPTPSATPEPTATPTLIPTPTDTPLPRPIATLNAAGQVGLGVYVQGVPYESFASVDGFERLVGHKMEYVLWFQSWGDSDRVFQTQYVALANRMGLVPVITWEPWKRNFADPTAIQPAYSLESIVAGSHDAYIVGWAQAARDTGVPIILRFAHEQSTEPGIISWYPWQGDPQGYREAFRHVVAVFRQVGADNVRFLWSAMWLNSWAEEYFPGDDVVDYVGTTILNHGTGAVSEWARWRSFAELFDPQYQAALQWGKPVIITELATAEQDGDKAAWLTDCLNSLEFKYTTVRAAILLEDEADREWPLINWSIGSSPESLAAFRLAISSPYYR
ncbi:MAG: hypothetical protein MUQ10_19220 [Anaerolineae bacterium]|nr:hypothetical protein [Anaerolineae bacterium]